MMVETAPHSPSRLKEWLYLDLTLLGTIIPVYFFARHFAAEGLSLTGFLQQAFVNPVATGLTSDLLLTSLVFWLFAAHELKRLGQSPGKLALLIVLNVCIGLSCALPAFLWWRERQGAEV